MEYIIVTAKDANALTLRVNDKLRDGWQLVGGLAIAYDPQETAYYGQTCMFAQAMTRFLLAQGVTILDEAHTSTVGRVVQATIARDFVVVE